MSALPPDPDAQNPDAAARLERQSLALMQACDLGLDLARALRDQVVSGREGPFGDPGLAFSRISRAIRLSIALDARLHDGSFAAAEPNEPRDVEPEGEPAAEAAADEPEPAAETELGERPERPDRENLRENLREDLSEAALFRRPTAELWAIICRDLDLDPQPGLFPGDAGAPAPRRKRLLRGPRPQGPETKGPAPQGPRASRPQNPPVKRPPQPPDKPWTRQTAPSGRADLLRSACAAPLAARGPIFPRLRAPP